MDDNLVWEATVDDNTWLVEVTRTGDYTGTLEVYRVSNDEKIFSQDVGLSYGAVFGPDEDDVSYWEDIVIEAIDRADTDE